MSFAPKQFIRSVDFLSTENAINTSTGCVNIYGGMSVSKDSYLTNMIVVGNTTINNLNITGTLISSTGNSLVSSQWVNSGANGIYFGTSSNTLVGIGTTTPGFTLDISGGSRITGGLTVGNLNVNTGATITNILNTTICTGTILTTGITTSNLRATGNVSATQSNITTMSGSTLQLSTGITTGSLNATSITTASLRVTGTMNSGDVTVGNINFTGSLFQNGSAYLGSQWTTTAGNLLTYTSGNVNISNVFTSNTITTPNLLSTNVTVTNMNSSTNTIGTLNATGITTTSLLATNGVLTNVTITNMNSSTNTIGTLNATGITTTSLLATNGVVTNATITNMNSSTNTIGTLNATGITTTSLFATSASIGNISAGTINLSNNMNIAGTLTVVNVTTTNLMMSNGNAILNLVTSGSILNTGTITSGPVVLRTPNNFDGRALTLSTLTAGNAYNLTLNAVSNTNNNVYWTINQNTLSSTYSNMLTFYGGNIGINTTQASSRLVISDTGATKGHLKLVANTGATEDNWWLGFSHNDSSDSNDRARIGAKIQAGGAGRLFFTTGGFGSQAERMTIDASGNIGIGTTSPGNTLDVTGTGRITTSLTTGSLFSTNQTTTNIVGTNSTFGGLTSTGLVYLLSTAGNIASTSNNYSITSGSVNITGDVVISGNQLFFTTTGVGTPTLNGRGNGSKIVLYPETGIGLGDYSIGVESGHMWFQVPNINYAGYKFYQGTTTSLIITTVGNIGIGATSPSRLLSLSGPSSNIVNGPHIWINTSDSPVNPVFQQLNWTADNVSLNFDMYYDGQFRNSGSSVAWQIYKSNSQLRFMLQNGTAGSSNGQFNAMILGSTGNVGIGSASSAAYILDIAGTTRITNTSSTSMGSLIVAGPNSSAPATATSGQLVSFYGGGGAASISNIDLSTYLPTSVAMSLPSVRFSMLDLGANNSNFNILTKNAGSTGTMASRIFIDGSGNIGINTTVPSSRLNVIMSDATSAGSATVWDSTYSVFGQSSNTGGAVGIGYHSSSGGSLSCLSPSVSWQPMLYRSLNHQFIVGGTVGTPPSMVINTAGNVGIGTTAPSALLYINSASASYNRGNSLYIRTQQSGIVLDSTQATNGRTWNIWSTISSDTPGAGSFAIFDSTASTYRILINTSGNVGIGLTAPTNRLDISGNLRVTNGGLLATGDSNTVGSLFTTSGNIGIGTTSPVTKLHVHGQDVSSNTAYFSGVDVNKRTAIAHDGTRGLLFAYNYGGSVAQDLVLNTPGGNIGINTASPQTKLHVEDGSVFIGDVSAGFSTSVPSLNTGVSPANGHRLFFDNSYNGTAGTGVAANKIVLHNNNFTCGFGLENLAVTYHSGQLHRFYCDATTGYGSLALSVGSSQTLVTTNLNGEGLLKIGNSNAGSSAYGVLRIGNNVGDAVMFLNSSTRTIDGGVNTYTIRNDIGALRLQGSLGTNTLFLPGSSSNIGINTTSPRANIEITQTSTTTGVMLYSGADDAGINSIFFNHSATSSAYQKVAIQTRALGNGQMARSHFGILVNTANDSSNVSWSDVKLFIHGSSGNVGIMTTSPSYPLHVSGDIYASGDVISFSDSRLKTDISTIDNALDKVSSMRGVYYTNINTQERDTGVIAQEIAEILPEVVADRGEYLGVAYGNIVGILIEAIKELKARVSELENR